MNGQQELSSVGSLIPEFYYDLIARIAPGAVLIIITLAGFRIAFGYWPEAYTVFHSFARISSFLGVIVFLILCYAVGLCLNWLAFKVETPFFVRSFLKVAARYEKVQKALDLE